MPKLTDTLARAAPLPAAGYVLVRDDDTPGFVLRIDAGGRRTFAVDVWARGRSWRRSIGPVSIYSASAARKIARGIVGELMQGRDARAELLAEARAAATIADALRAYVRARPLAARTAADYLGLLAHELAPFSGRRLAAFDRAAAVAAHQEISRRCGPTRANYALRVLRAVALDAGAPNPCGRRFPWAPATPRRARLEPSQARALWLAFAGAPVAESGRYFRLLLASGMRRGEASALRVRDFERDRARLVLRATKSGRDHVVYLAPPVLALLEEQAAAIAPSKRTAPRPAALLFPGCGDPRKTLEAAARAIGATFSAHDLRKAFALCAIEAGIAWPLIKTMLNHSLGAAGDVTLKHYAHASEAQLREAWARVAAFLVREAAPEVAAPPEVAATAEGSA
jgi:integrase